MSLRADERHSDTSSRGQILAQPRNVHQWESGSQERLQRLAAELRRHGFDLRNLPAEARKRIFDMARGCGVQLLVPGAYLGAPLPEGRG